MTSRLRILAPTRYQWLFNGPRSSSHIIEKRDFLPMNYLSWRLEGFTVFNPLPPRRFDLIHAYNRIPLSTLPFVIGFESHLPRALGMESTRYFHWLTRRLESPRCRAIIAISEFAKRIFLTMHQGGRSHDTLVPKLHVRYPSMEIPSTCAASREVEGRGSDSPLRVCFVGNHFARKGGCVAVRLAELARLSGFPLHIDIVSRLQVGSATWTDPVDPEFFKPYFRLLEQPNITLYKGLPNSAALAVLRRADFCLLTTFSDTFGYSAIEAMCNHVPVIATRQGALPEFIIDGRNGILLDLATNSNGEWVHGTDRRDTAAYANLFRDEVERLASSAFASIVSVVDDPGRLAAMRAQCYRDAAERFSASAATAYWDQLYQRAVDD
jgi:glycosyltransferase involved in cell wall biosynthesis